MTGSGGRANEAEWDALILRAETEPIGIDLSDFADMFCNGFLAGQQSILEEIRYGRLDLPLLSDEADS